MQSRRQNGSRNERGCGDVVQRPCQRPDRDHPQPLRDQSGAAEPSPPVFYLAILAHFDFRKAPVEDRIGVGKGLTKADAMAGAVGEALERYCGSQPELGSRQAFCLD